MEIVRLRSNLRRVADSCVTLLFPSDRGVRRIVWEVEGFIFPHEAALLYEVGRFASEGRAIVEIGSMRGLSTCCLAAGVRDAVRPSRVVAIDPHLYGSEPEFRYNLSRIGVTDLVEVRVDRVEVVAPHWHEEVSAVFIDGAHDLQSVLRDFTTWTPMVRAGGFVLVHDSTTLSRFPGPAFVAETRVRVGEVFDMVGQVGSISWGRKSGGGGWFPVLRAARLVDLLIRAVKRGRSEPAG
jgi:MMP 1-O-methyltransferase